MPRSNFTRSTSELLNATLHSSFLLDRAAPSLFRHRLYRIFDFCGAGSPGFAEANAGPVSVGELDAQACRSCFGPVGAIDRTAHFVPSDRRPRMEDHAPPHFRDRVARDRNPFDYRLAREIGIQRPTVRGLNARMIDETRQRPCGVAIAPRRRRPLDGRNFAARARNRVGEHGQSDI